METKWRLDYPDPWPFPDTFWKHTNGTIYIVEMIANYNEGDDPAKREKFPATVVYSNPKNGNIYARRLDDWHRSMTRVYE